MIDLLSQVNNFIFVFSILALVRLIFKLSKSIFSNPPIKLEISLTETIVTGLFVSYIITYLIS